MGKNKKQDFTLQELRAHLDVIRNSDLDKVRGGFGAPKKDYQDWNIGCRTDIAQ